MFVYFLVLSIVFHVFLVHLADFYVLVEKNLGTHWYLPVWRGVWDTGLHLILAGHCTGTIAENVCLANFLTKFLLACRGHWFQLRAFIEHVFKSTAFEEFGKKTSVLGLRAELWFFPHSHESWKVASPFSGLNFQEEACAVRSLWYTFASSIYITTKCPWLRSGAYGFAISKQPKLARPADLKPIAEILGAPEATWLARIQAALDLEGGARKPDRSEPSRWYSWCIAINYQTCCDAQDV